METTTHQSSNVPHILLTSLGTRLFEKPTEYEWNCKKAKAFLTPLALVELLEAKQLPNRVIAVVSQEAKSTTWPIFKTGIGETLGFVPEAVDIPNGNNREEINQILESVANRIPEGAELTLDVTQGLRHFPFIFYALVLYLKSLRGVKIRGAYYGMVEGDPSNDPKPIIDLQPLLELPEWFHAVRMFRDQGTTNPMADLLQPLANRLDDEKAKLFKSGDTEAGAKREIPLKRVNDSINWLGNYAFAYESALPLELEKASRGLSNSIEELPAIKELPSIGNTELPPLVEELTRAIIAAAEKSALKMLPGKGGNWKQNVVLDKDELERQADMVDVYLDRDQLSLAAGLMREWVVSWSIWESGNCADIEKWLTPEVRGRYEHKLGAIGASARDPASKSTIETEQKEFGSFWNQLANELRNAFHHHAMRPEAMENAPKSLKTVHDFWNELKKGSVNLPPLGGDRGRLLLSPQGMRPGVLFSALNVAQPDTCLVICSEASASRIPEAASHASFDGCLEHIVLTDPLGGFDEIDAIAERAHPYLLSASEVIANMTGGSTLMGLILQRLVEDAQKLDRPVKRFALIDRRSSTEQDSNPFVQGDSHWLD